MKKRRDRKSLKLKAGWKRFLKKINPSISTSDLDKIIVQSFREYLEELEKMTDEEQLREFKSFLRRLPKK